MKTRDLKKLVRLHRTKQALEERLGEVTSLYESSADELMPELWAHPLNEGRRWEIEENFHPHCSDCMATAVTVAKKVLEAREAKP